MGLKIVVHWRSPSKQILEDVRKALEEVGADYTFVASIKEMGSLDGRPDLVLVIGGDRDVLEALHSMPDEPFPILGVSMMDERSFLTEAPLQGLKASLARVKRGNYQVEEAQRLAVRVDGAPMPPAINEVAIFPYRSATLMEYLLSINGEPLWRDQSDGLIVATPTGSTAYSLSAGGPMILMGARVFVIVSVNSLDVTRRPVVVHEGSIIRMSDMTSRYDCEVIVDGLVRRKVKEEVEVTRASYPAKLIRLPEASAAMDRMIRKVRLAEDLLKMPPSAKLILKTLEYEGPLSYKELAEKTMLPERTTRLALSILLRRGLVKRRSLLRDARKKIYTVAS